MKPKVILQSQETYNPREIAEKVSGALKSLGVSPAGKRVFVKPSFVYPSRSPEVQPVITQVPFIKGVLIALREHGARELLVGESSVMGPSRISFHATGFLAELDSLARPLFLDEEEEVEVKVPDPLVQASFQVPKVFMEADLFVSLPKIKTNMFAELTLTVKNNLGLLRQRARLLYHDHRLHKKLADLYKVRPPDLVFADCIVAGEGQGPLMAEPVPLGLIISGNHAVAVDLAACRLAGYRPEEIEHIKLLIEQGYGPKSLDEVELEGEELFNRARSFKRPQAGLQGLSPRVRAFLGEELACPWGCVGLVRGALDAYLDLYGPEKMPPINIIAGKPVTSLPDDLDPEITLALGDCAEPHKSRGHFVPGCCPLPLDIGLKIREIMGPVAIEFSLGDVLKGYAGHAAWRARQRLLGKKPRPVENHPGLPRMAKEISLMLRFRKKMKDSS